MKGGPLMRRLILAGAAIGALLLTASCDSRGGRAPCPTGKLCLEYGNTVDPGSLDPALAASVQEDHILGDLFTGLTQYDPLSRPVPGMATSWEVSPDGLVWTFHLRPAKWSDGVELTADDFVYALRRVVDPKLASEYANLLYVIKNGEAVNDGKAPATALGVEAPDPRTVRITLAHPAPYFLYITTHQVMYPVPRHVVEKWGDQWTEPEHWVSNGAYRMTQFTLGDRVHVERNPYFYDADKVCIDQINYYPTYDTVSAERRVKRGELDFNDSIDSSRVPFLKRPDQMPAYVKVNTWLGTTYMAFNGKRQPAFRDVRVRQALTMAIDRDFLSQKLMRGVQPAANTFVPPGVANYPGGAEPHWAKWPLERRQAEARRLLAAAGYGPGRPLKVDVVIRNNSGVLMYTAVQADWKALGVETTLSPEEGQIAFADFNARNFEIADAGWIADYNDPTTFLNLLRSNAGQQNFSDYANPAFDALMDKADHEPDPVARGRDLAEAEHMAMEDATIAPVFFYASKNLVSPKLTGWAPNLADWHRTRYLCFVGHKQP
jgi:oligopeptide transport system substrate-binding protein